LGLGQERTGSVPNVDPGGGDKEGVYFQYWDSAKNAPAYNDGANGLERLDYVLAKANDLGLKIIVVLVNNWRAFGGVDQYLTWYNRKQHDEFFTAPEVKAAYQRWVEHVALRTNTLNGRVYKNDPTIFAWELANEPRATGGAAFDRGTGWDAHTITAWADEMSRFIKSIDQQHLVSVGDEGFLNDGGEHWAYQAKDGVDHRALTALPAVDFGTFHLYPGHWGTTPEWGDRWIVDHLRVARELQKPTLLEEFGMKVERADDKLGPVVAGGPERERAYTRWNDLLLERGGTGSLPWMLAGIDEGPGNPRYPDYDGFAFYRDDATGRLIRNVAQKFGRAPACAEQAPSTSAPSPFVRVRRAPESTAFGWRENSG
jgi:mannan endo-1,4-beta-mannosidase